MKWLRCTDPSCKFSDFFPSIAFASVSTTEDDIFTNMRFSITNDEIEEMEALKKYLLISLQISGI